MSCSICDRDFSMLSQRPHKLDGKDVCRDCFEANGGVLDEVKSLGQLHQMAWKHVRGAEIVVESRESGEERRGEIVGRHVGERIYYDSRRGEDVVTYDTEMVVIDTERDTTLEVPTDAYDLVEFNPAGDRDG